MLRRKKQSVIEEKVDIQSILRSLEKSLSELLSMRYSVSDVNSFIVVKKFFKNVDI